MKEKNRKLKVRHKYAQVTIEFAFTFIVAVLMLYGCVKVMQWLGFNIGDPMEKHYQGLYSQCTGSASSCNPISQLDAADSLAGQGLPKLNAVFRGQLISP